MQVQFLKLNLFLNHYLYPHQNFVFEILHYFQIDEESEEWKLSHPSGITRKEKEMRDAAGLGAVAGGDDSLNINRGTRKNLVQQKLKEASGADLVPSRKSLSLNWPRSI